MNGVDENLLALQDYLTGGQWVPAGLIAVLIVAPLILKATGKKIPMLDAALKMASGVVLKLVPKKEKPAPAKPEDQPGTESVTNVVDIRDIKK